MAINKCPVCEGQVFAATPHVNLGSVKVHMTCFFEGVPDISRDPKLTNEQRFAQRQAAISRRTGDILEMRRD
jgi:hypothetical protein